MISDGSGILTVKILQLWYFGKVSYLSGILELSIFTTYCSDIVAILSIEIILIAYTHDHDVLHAGAVGGDFSADSSPLKGRGGGAFLAGW